MSECLCQSSTIVVHGTLTAVGVLEPRSPQECEIEIRTADGESRIRGLTLEQARKLAPLLYQEVTITVEASPR
jgi:hypothetical protein